MPGHVPLIVVDAAAFSFGRSLSPACQELPVNAAGVIPYKIGNRVDIGPAHVLAGPGLILTSMFLHDGTSWETCGSGGFSAQRRGTLGRIHHLVFFLPVGTVGAAAQGFTLPDPTSPIIGLWAQ